jgi:hypothetical protein
MIYLIHPGRTMKFAKTPGISDDQALGLVREAGQRYLKQLSWEDTTSLASFTVVRLALRYGLACDGGILLDSGFIGTAEAPAHIAEVHATAERDWEALRPKIEEMERAIPGLIPMGDLLSADEGIASAHEDIAFWLEDAEPKDDLISAWRSLGGAVPDEA